MNPVSNNEYIDKFNELKDKTHDMYQDMYKENAEVCCDRRFQLLCYFGHLEPTKENINYGDEWKLVEIRIEPNRSRRSCLANIETGTMLNVAPCGFGIIECSNETSYLIKFLVLLLFTPLCFVFTMIFNLLAIPYHIVSGIILGCYLFVSTWIAMGAIIAFSELFSETIPDYFKNIFSDIWNMIRSPYYFIRLMITAILGILSYPFKGGILKQVVSYGEIEKKWNHGLHRCHIWGVNNRDCTLSEKDCSHGRNPSQKTFFTAPCMQTRVENLFHERVIVFDYGDF